MGINHLVRLGVAYFKDSKRLNFFTRVGKYTIRCGQIKQANFPTAQCQGKVIAAGIAKTVQAQPGSILQEVFHAHMLHGQHSRDI
jgi:hypothetical protein